jgi:NitT/TauT family transport system permease protein
VTSQTVRKPRAIGEVVSLFVGAIGHGLGGSSAFIVIGRIAVLFALVAVWYGLSELSLVPHTLLPTPSETWTAFLTLIDSGQFWPNLESTIEATLIALVLAGIPGAVIGLALALLPRTEAILAPYLDALNSAPRIALAPMLIVIFGIGQSPKIFLAGTLVIFVVLMSARAGVHSADQDYLRLLTVMGASKFQVFMKALLPVSIPSIAAGLRLGLIYSLLGVVAMELIASRAGLGQLIAQYSAVFDMPKVYAILIVLVLVAASLNSGTRYAERRLLAWQPPSSNR